MWHRQTCALQRLLELVVGQHGSALRANPDQQLTQAAMAPVLQQLWAELPAFVAEQALVSLPRQHLSWLWAGQSAGTLGSEHQRYRYQIGAFTSQVTCWAAHPVSASSACAMQCTLQLPSMHPSQCPIILSLAACCLALAVTPPQAVPCCAGSMQSLLYQQQPPVAGGP